MEIVDKETAILAKRLAERKIALELAPNAKALIAKEGFDAAYGARSIKRAIQRLVLDPLAQKVLMGEFKEGDTAMVDAQDGKIVFWSEQYAAEKAAEGATKGKKPVGAGARKNRTSGQQTATALRGESRSSIAHCGTGANDERVLRIRLRVFTHELIASQCRVADGSVCGRADSPARPDASRRLSDRLPDPEARTG
jgi:hypothetical protein